MNFNQLVATIRNAHDELAKQANRAVNVGLTLRNWLIGRYIAEYELNGADRADYGENVLSELAARLHDVSNKLEEFLMELGNYFCFEARQRRILIGNEHFFVDLVFYHRVLKCIFLWS